MCLEDLGLLYASELLRKPCLQPYLLRFQNLSPIYLPVFPIDSPKDKTRKSQLRNVDVGVVSGQEAETQEEVLEPMDERKLSISSSEVVAESECLSGSVEVNEAKTSKERADALEWFVGEMCRARKTREV
ncbi:hypothetical protein YC2023_068095 [Brassica napus]